MLQLKVVLQYHPNPKLFHLKTSQKSPLLVTHWHQDLFWSMRSIPPHSWHPRPPHLKKLTPKSVKMYHPLPQLAQGWEKALIGLQRVNLEVNSIWYVLKESLLSMFSCKILMLFWPVLLVVIWSRTHIYRCSIWLAQWNPISNIYPPSTMPPNIFVHKLSPSI